MKSGSQSLGLFGNWAPTVLVLCSEDVDKACQKNGDNFNFISILKAFNLLKQDALSYKLTSGGKQIIRSTFSLHCTNVPTMLELIANKNPFPNVLLQCPPVEIADRVKVESLNKTISMLCGKTTSTPWFNQYCKEYVNAMSPSSHEVFLHPVCLLFVASYTDPTPVQTFQQQFINAKKKLPNYMDLEVLKVYLIVHDESVPIDEKAKQAATQRFQELRKGIMPSKCYYISINGRKEEKGELVLSKQTSGSFPLAMSKLPTSTLLSEVNFESISGAIALVVTDNILPFMQTTIATLNQEVINHRSGIKHKVCTL